MNSGLSRYISIRSPNESETEYRLNFGKNTIGRNADNDIYISDDSASRNHAEILYHKETNTIKIVDLNSTNGTFINGKRIRHPQEISANDVVRIGLFMMTFMPVKAKTSNNGAPDITDSVVTSELVLESIGNYSVFLHNISKQLINVPELPVALEKISRSVRGMIGAEKCSILMLDEIDEIETLGIPKWVFQGLVEDNVATIFGSNSEDSDSQIVKENTNDGRRLVAPVRFKGKTVAIISAMKSPTASFPFNFNDMQIVIAVSDQVSMAIQRNRLEIQLLHNATHDSLTGLPNRSMFIDRLSQAFEMSKRRKNHSFAVLFIDVDDFKIINDTRGHEIGDKLLVELSGRLDKHLRKTDTTSFFGSVARFGGDEFAVLLTGLNNDIDAILVARRICELATLPFIIDGRKLEISLSVGLTTNNLGYRDPDEMLRDADIAMYRAKDSGKNRAELYDTKFHGEVMDRLETQNAVKKALDLQEFRVHYQPIINLETGNIIGHEALLRWYSPERGIVFPNEFVNLLDTGNLLGDVDHWVLREACLQTMQWQKSFSSTPNLAIAVNFSSNNFMNADIVEHIQYILKDTKLPPDRLWLEITENVSLDISDLAQDILEELHAIGIHICIDDFGKGYSALNYLIDLPIDILKIDTTIIHRIDEIPESRKITNAVILLAKELEIKIVAEGIENHRQLSLISKLGCDYGQGYHLGKPILPEEAEKLLGSLTK